MWYQNIGRHAVDSATNNVCHITEVKAVWSGDMNSDVAYSKTIQYRRLNMEECCPAERYRTPWQLTSGTRIFKLVCMLKQDRLYFEQILTMSISDWMCVKLLTRWLYCTKIVPSSNVCISQGVMEIFIHILYDILSCFLHQKNFENRFIFG